MNKRLLTAKQVQELLHVDRTTIYRMLKDGRLTGVKVGKHWRFAEQEVDELLSGSGSVDEIKPSPGQVLPLHCMQNIQDVFAEIAEVGSVTTDEDGQPLTEISNPCDFCILILESERGKQACIESWKLLAQTSETAPDFHECHAGLQYARAPIVVDGDLIANLVAGQFYLSEPDLEEEMSRFQLLSRKYDIDKDLLFQAAKKLPVLDSRKAPKISGWLQRVARTLAQISHERSDLMGRLKKISMMTEIE